jgi:hypothetical protein
LFSRGNKLHGTNFRHIWTAHYNHHSKPSALLDRHLRLANIPTLTQNSVRQTKCHDFYHLTHSYDFLTIKICYIVWIVMVGNVNKYSDLEREPVHLLDFILTLKRIVCCKINHRKDHILGKGKKALFELLILSLGYKVVS